MSSSKHKMYDYEVTPPAQVWEKVAAALDEAALHQDFPKKLYEATASPPAGVWENISKELEAEVQEAAPVVTLHKRFVSWVRYAAAAVLITGIAFAVYRITAVSPSANEDAFASAQTKQETDTNNTLPAAPSGITAETAPAAANDNKTTTAANNIAYTSQKRNSQRATTASYSDEATDQPVYAALSRGTADDWRSNPLYAYEDHVPDLSDRYILLMTPEGKLIRVSKKLGDLVCCVAGEEQDDDCKNKLKKWQQKLAEMPVSSAPGNFLDILNMVTSLESINL
ncbi:MAG TPA: anti-sigma factor [Chitinophagaceae bacterium]|nr:anti-sigma factor [Chitinophagaceae bacterium]